MAKSGNPDGDFNQIEYEPFENHEILYEGNVFYRHRNTWLPVANSLYFGKTWLEAKEFQGLTRIVFYKKKNKALNQHKEMLARAAAAEEIPSYEEQKPGFPFKYSVLKDRFTIDSEQVDRFLGNHGHPINPINLLPVLQQILTNQKEIMEILNTKPEDKMIKNHFLNEFDEKMKEAMKL